MNYKTESKKVYANLYEIVLSKDLKLYQYPFEVAPKIEAGDIKIRDILCRSAFREL